MPEPPRKRTLDRLKDLWPFRRKKRDPETARHPAEKISDFSTQRYLKALLELIKGLEQTHKHIEPGAIWGTALTLIKIQDILTKISRQNPQFDFDKFDVNLEISTKKGIIIIKFDSFIKAILERIVKVEHLFEDTNSSLIYTVLNALEIVERQPQTAHLEFQKIFDALLRKFALKRRLLEMRTQNTLEEQYSVFHNYITEFPGLVNDLIELDRLFAMVNTNTKKWFLAKIKQSLNTPELVSSGIIKGILKAYTLRQEEANRPAEAINVERSDQEVQQIDLSLRVVHQIEPLAKKYPKLNAIILVVKDYIKKSYTRKQRFELEFLLEDAINQNQLDMFVSFLISYYKEPNTLIAHLQRSMK